MSSASKETRLRVRVFVFFCGVLQDMIATTICRNVLFSRLGPDFYQRLIRRSENRLTVSSKNRCKLKAPLEDDGNIAYVHFHAF